MWNHLPACDWPGSLSLVADALSIVGCWLLVVGYTVVRLICGVVSLLMCRLWAFSRQPSVVSRQSSAARYAIGRPVGRLLGWLVLLINWWGVDLLRLNCYYYSMLVSVIWIGFIGVHVCLYIWPLQVNRKDLMWFIETSKWLDRKSNWLQLSFLVKVFALMAGKRWRYIKMHKFYFVHRIHITKGYINKLWDKRSNYWKLNTNNICRQRTLHLFN